MEQEHHMLLNSTKTAKVGKMCFGSVTLIQTTLVLMDFFSTRCRD